MRNQKTYFLDLQTLLTYLSGQSCELTTELKVSGKAARGLIVQKEGRIVHCQLTLQNGFQATGEQAYKQLETCTQWQVELEQPGEKERTSPPAPFSPQRGATSSLPVPPASVRNSRQTPLLRQKRPLNSALLQSLPIKERLILRSVYTMLNGERSSEEIKAQLRLPPRDIDEALERLRMLDLIE